MHEITDWSSSEHRLISRVLASLGTYVSSLGPGTPDARAVLADYFRFFRRYVEGRHARIEETVIFGELAEFAGVAGGVELLTEEHRQRADRLADLEALCAGGGPLDQDEIEQLTEEVALYSSHLRAHILKEDRALFPMAGTLLPEERISRIAAGLASFPRNGDQTDLVTLAEDLVERYPPLS